MLSKTKAGSCLYIEGRFDECLYLLAMVCTSFVAINRATNQRYPDSPLGNTLVPSVQIGNILAARHGASAKQRSEWVEP